MSAEAPSFETLRLGVSSCLLGREVRFDGGHKHDRFLTGHLGEYVEWVPVCPEVESGLPIPRPSMRLLESADGVRMVDPKSGEDHTARLERYSTRRIRELRKLDLSGYIFKKDSPSCGVFRVKLYGEKGMPRRDGRGLFAEALIRAFPYLPVEEEGRLQDAGLREGFIERIFAYRRLRELFAGRWTNGDVVKFHTAHKLQVMAHSNESYRELGRLVAEIKPTPRAAFRDAYEEAFTRALAIRATRAKATNALQHAAGHLKQALDSAARTELAELIHDYRTGLVPLVVPITLLRHHVRAQGVSYLQGQTFLEPHPRELMLRNHV